MSSGIPQDSNFRNLSCQLGGLRLNGNVDSGTAKSYSVLTVDDPKVVRNVTKSFNGSEVTGNFIEITVSGVNYYLPLYS